MPTSAAARTGITRWSAEADPFNRTQTDADHALLDDLVGIDLHDGALAARPAVGIRGRYFTESAASAGLPGTTWREDGVTAWRAVGSRVLSQSTTDVAQVVAGVTGQTADLVQWRAGASTLGRVDNTGQLFAVGAQLGPSPQTALAAMLGVTPASSAAIAAIIRGAVSQSGDLQQWQTNVGTAVAKVDATGAGTFAALTTAGTMTGRLARWTAAAVGDVPAQVTGFAGQTGNLTEWRSSTPTVLASVAADGSGTFANLTTAGTVTGRLARWTAAAVGDIPVQVTAAAGQTGDLQQWRSNAGTVMAKLTAVGNLVTRPAAAQGVDVNADVHFNAGGASDKPLVVRGFSGQSASLQEWQDSAAVVRAKVDAFGQLSVGSPAATFVGDASFGALLSLQPTATQQTAIIVKAMAGQGSDLVRFYDAVGNIKSRIDGAGNPNAAYLALTKGSVFPGGGGTVGYLRCDVNGALWFTTPAGNDRQIAAGP